MHEMDRAKERTPLRNVSSFGRGMASLVCLVPGPRGEREGFGTLGVARIYGMEVAYKQIRQRNETAALSTATQFKTGPSTAVAQFSRN